MKRILIFFAIGIVLFVFFWQKISFFHTTEKVNPRLPIPTSTPTQLPSKATTTLFVPYWTLIQQTFPTSYDTIAYFGITANTSGIDTKEDGYKDMPKFISLINVHQKKLLVIRLLDQNTDEKILHDSGYQKKIIDQSTNIAKHYGFDGIILDLEYKALAFDEVIQSITNFSTHFAASVHTAHMLFYQTLYGDTIYRLRPFDVSAIGKVSDGVFILAYDFHKANGNPGPNFPFNELPDENYNFSQMVTDFSQKIPANKLTIVYGLFGYDWKVDDKGQSIGQAESLTTNQILQKFVVSCPFKNCEVNQTASSETEITYEDMNSVKHIVWFEDLTSLYRKKDVLQRSGIFSIAFWAWEYF